MVFNDKRAVQSRAPAPVNDVWPDARRTGNVSQVLDLFHGHERRAGIQPVAVEACVLVARQIVERAEVPARDDVREVLRDESSQDADVEVGSGGTRDERRSDPQRTRLSFMAHHVGECKHVRQDDCVVLPGEHLVARTVGFLQVVEDQIRLPCNGEKPVVPAIPHVSIAVCKPAACVAARNDRQNSAWSVGSPPETVTPPSGPK